MHDDLDRALAGVAAMPLDPRLTGLDAVVLARLASDAGDARRGARIGAVATFGALAMGIVASTTLATPTPARASPLAPFGAAAPLAPSTLLEGGQ
ncbi:hypothetical protein ACVWZA_003638 [Sphingomonas sp. UYAg733]